MYQQTRRKLFIGSILAVVMMNTAQAGGTVTGSMEVSATVASSCSAVTATALSTAYNVLDTGAKLFNSTMTVTCTKSTTLANIALSAGSNAVGNQKRMLAATSTEYLTYNVLQPTGV
jgi:spore coat protein U-like protein